MEIVPVLLSIMILAVASSYTVTANAQILCNEPLPPICLEDGSSFDNVAAHRRCLSDIEVYVEKLQEYIDCSREKLESAIRAKESAQKRAEEVEKLIDQ